MYTAIRNSTQPSEILHSRQSQIPAGASTQPALTNCTQPSEPNSRVYTAAQPSMCTHPGSTHYPCVYTSRVYTLPFLVYTFAESVAGPPCFAGMPANPQSRKCAASEYTNVETNWTYVVGPSGRVPEGLGRGFVGRSLHLRPACSTSTNCVIETFKPRPHPER